MRDLPGRVAVVTGGGSGIGAALCRALAREGMHVVVADVEAGPAEALAAELSVSGAKCLAAAVDVGSAEAMHALAARVEQELGGCHLLANNAGVLLQRPFAELEASDWEWVLRVNLHGVLNGVAAFLPGMLARGEEAHIVCTASAAGLLPLESMAPYVTSKFAVVGLCEAMRLDLDASPIGVSVLCPGGVATRIQDSARNRPGALRGDEPTPPASPAPELTEEEIAARAAEIQSPEQIAAAVVEAVLENRFYVMTHPTWQDRVDARHAEIHDAFVHAGKRP